MFEKRAVNKENPWEGAMEPFKIAGNVYFVGTYQSSSHLIDTGDGLILIDTGYANTLYLVVHSIHKLGFDPTAIKYIINTHHHYDHTAGSAALAGLTGAKNIIGKDDYENAKQYFDADILVKDGDTLSLGNTTVRFAETPGHTKGTISLFFDVTENGKVYRAGMFGGTGRNTLVPEKYDYEGCREDYRKSVARLREENVEIVLGNHCWNNDTERKGIHLAKTGENHFIDDGSLWQVFLNYCERRLDEVIAAN